MLDPEINPEGFPKTEGITVTRFAPHSGIELPAVASAERKPRKRFTRTCTNTIMAAQVEPIRWIVPGYVPEGLSILAGRQKLGKTWLGIDMAVAVACGGSAMGAINCEPGAVLYIDMENGSRRIQRRVDILFPDPRRRPDLSRLEWVTEAPALNDGFIDALEDWRQSVGSPRFVVIDVLQRIKPAGNVARNSYENDYSTMAELQQWATKHGIAVMALHHTRKGGADDPLEALSGSNGLSACADTTLVLDRDASGITLYVRGRDVEEKETALKFTSGIWTIQGEAAEVRRSDQRGVILDFLRNNPEPITPGDLATELGWKSNNTKQLLYQMARKGEVFREKGHYSLAPHNPDNRDNRIGRNDDD